MFKPKRQKWTCKVLVQHRQCLHSCFYSNWTLKLSITGNFAVSGTFILLHLPSKHIRPQHYTILPRSQWWYKRECKSLLLCFTTCKQPAVTTSPPTPPMYCVPKIVSVIVWLSYSVNWSGSDTGLPYCGAGNEKVNKRVFIWTPPPPTPSQLSMNSAQKTITDPNRAGISTPASFTERSRLNPHRAVNERQVLRRSGSDKKPEHADLPGNRSFVHKKSGWVHQYQWLTVENNSTSHFPTYI